jgi:hypothetical protein
MKPKEQIMKTTRQQRSSDSFSTVWHAAITNPGGFEDYRRRGLQRLLQTARALPGKVEAQEFGLYVEKTVLPRLLLSAAFTMVVVGRENSWRHVLHVVSIENTAVTRRPLSTTQVAEIDYAS